MILLLCFLFGTFILSASLASRGRTLSMRILLPVTAVVAIGFYSLRVIS